MKMYFDMQVLTIGLTLSALELLFSLRKGSATKGQMQRRGVKEGLPLLWHGAFPGNIVLTFWFAHLAKLYGAEWATSHWLDHVMSPYGIRLGMPDWFWAFLVGAVIATGMRILYAQSTVVEAHNENGPTAAGWVQTVSMTGGFALGFLFFFPSTAQPDPSFMWQTASLLVLYFAAANHFVPGIVKLWSRGRLLQFFPGNPLASAIGWISIAAPGVGMYIAAYLRLRR